MKSLFAMAAPGGDDWRPADALRRRPPPPRPVLVPVDRVNPPTRQEIDSIAERLAKLESLLEDGEYVGAVRAKIIIKAVALKHGVTVNDIKGPFRQKALVDARHEAFYRLRTETTLSYPSIGRYVGDKDHTTVLHGAIKHARANGLPLPGKPNVE